jgi:cobalamin biosynthesis Mg chelatase CobN
VLPTATAQPVVPTGTPVPTLAEEEISAAETAGPPPAPTEAGQATATAVSSALAATGNSETVQATPAASEVTATFASGENTTAVATATENPAVPGRNQPLLGWLLGVLTFAAAGFGVYWFLRRKKVA